MYLLYLSELIKMLDKKDPRWRSKTIILQDNAPYKSSASAFEYYKRHRLPIIFTGPHSYVSHLIRHHSDFYYILTGSLPN